MRPPWGAVSPSSRGRSRGRPLVGHHRPSMSRMDPLAPARDRRVVRRADHGEAGLLVEPRDDVEHHERALPVEVPGRLVQQQHARLVHERPRDAGPLPLAAGELRGEVARAVGEPDAPERRRAPPARRRSSGSAARASRSRRRRGTGPCGAAGRRSRPARAAAGSGRRRRARPGRCRRSRSAPTWASPSRRAGGGAWTCRSRRGRRGSPSPPARSRSSGRGAPRSPRSCRSPSPGDAFAGHLWSSRLPLGRTERIARVHLQRLGGPARRRRRRATTRAAASAAGAASQGRDRRAEDRDARSPLRRRAPGGTRRRRPRARPRPPPRAGARGRARPRRRARGRARSPAAARAAGRRASRRR